MKFLTSTLVAVLAATTVGGAAFAKTVTIKMDNMKFAPASVTVAKGDTVVWMNADSTKQPHNVQAKKGEFKSPPVIMVGKSFSWVANKVGTFDYTCTIHPGMNGTLIVK